MSPAHTAPDALESFSAELEQVQWFGRESVQRAPSRFATVDLFFAGLGAVGGALLYLFGPL